MDATGAAVTRITFVLRALAERRPSSRVASRTTIWCVLWFALGLGWVLPATAQAAAAKVVVSLSPNSILANGTSTSTATATVTDSTGAAVTADTVKFSSTAPNEKISGTTNVGNGTYTATITSSTAVRTAAITATDSSVTPAISGQATLTQTAGPVATVTLQVSPSSIIANGTATTTATATVKDAQGHLLSGQSVAFSSTDLGEKFSTPVKGAGTYTTTITSSTTLGNPTITATDSSVTPNLSGTAPLTQTAGPAARVTVQLNPSSILADGVSTTIATATVTDAQGHPLPSQAVSFTSSDPGQVLGSVSAGANGTYSVQIGSSTTVGHPTITASDSSVSPPVSGSQLLIQAGGTSTTTLVPSPSTVVTNQTLTLVALVSGAGGSPSGTITFTDGGVPIANCVREAITPSNTAATCQTSFAAVNSPEHLAAVFTPNLASAVIGSTGSAAVTVRPDSTSVVLDVSSDVGAGQGTTYTATVTPPASRPGPITPSGFVEFFDGGRPIPSCLTQLIVGGSAICTVSYKTSGRHVITASYRGDANFAGAVSGAETITVIPVPVQVLGIVSSTMQWTFQLHARLHPGSGPGRSWGFRGRNGGRPMQGPQLSVRPSREPDDETKAVRAGWQAHV